MNPFLVVNRHQLNARAGLVRFGDAPPSIWDLPGERTPRGNVPCNHCGEPRPFHKQPMLARDRALRKANPIGNSALPTRKTPALGRRGVSSKMIW
ncbi:hypothetical protein [Bradyrhizobium sp. KB893862 SZCCT0404]|uniref:hypothetical protein n=1 Tax=Bradyrhizobium sp. KB893862 SZCCT0404 TaxID=2807672 RepID=UPI001BADBBAA|nr:hypothetical protein [Bradyrhizobium sp. KB893862 SZCCT0404]